MTYYIRQAPGIHAQVWKIDDTIAIRLGITNAEGSANSYFKAEPGLTAFETMKKQASAWFEPDDTTQFHKTVLGPGQFYPRIARPTARHPTDFPRIPSMRHADTDFIAIARGQLTALTRQLQRICQTVHPCDATFGSYGHDIRNLLILACTEVETHWRGVLVANHRIGDQYSTNDYVLLQQAMKLGDYAIGFPAFPWLAAIQPFDGWGTTGKPSQELAWYAAYNAVKHNREHEFAKATLRHVFEAVSACVIMVIAQFGLLVGLGRDTELNAFFHLSKHASWPLSHVYLPKFGERNVEHELDYPF